MILLKYYNKDKFMGFLGKFLGNNIEKENSSVSGVEPIEESNGFLLRTEEDIEKIVELPLIGACKELYKKNIKTVSSLANRKDVEGLFAKEKEPSAYIEIEKESLSEENLEILKKIKKDPRFDYLQVEGLKDTTEKTIMIYILLDKTGFSVEDIIRSTKIFTDELKEQEPLWIIKNHIYKIEDLERKYGYNEKTDPEMWKEEGYYYDSESESFFESEDHFKKYKKYL
jgi:hypothetical protein